MVLPPRGRARSAVLAAILLLSACGETRPPPPEFHEGRAWSHLVSQISFGPRYAGNRGHGRQLEWMLDELRFRADTVVVQVFSFRGEPDTALTATNVLARWRPEAAERVLLAAHWDTRRRADGSPDPLDRKRPVPGANLNASGVAVLMELAELFRQQPPEVGVDLLLLDGDDYARENGLPGTRAFLEAMPGYAPRYAVVLEGVADRGARFPLDSLSLAVAPEAVDAVWAAAAELGYDSVFVADRASALGGAARLLAEAGIPVVVVADRDYGHGDTRRHAWDDMPEHVAREPLTAVGRTLASVVYGASPEPGPER